MSDMTSGYSKYSGTTEMLLAIAELNVIMNQGIRVKTDLEYYLMSDQIGKVVDVHESGIYTEAKVEYAGGWAYTWVSIFDLQAEYAGGFRPIFDPEITTP